MFLVFFNRCFLNRAHTHTVLLGMLIHPKLFSSLLPHPISFSRYFEKRCWCNWEHCCNRSGFDSRPTPFFLVFSLYLECVCVPYVIYYKCIQSHYTLLCGNVSVVSVSINSPSPCRCTHITLLINAHLASSNNYTQCKFSLLPCWL